MEASCQLRKAEKERWIQSEVGTEARMEAAQREEVRAKIHWLSATDALLAHRATIPVQED